MPLEDMGRRSPIERCNVEVQQWRSKSRVLVAAIAVLTLSGCEELMFTGKVDLGRWDFAASDLNTCLSGATRHELEISDKRPSKEIVTLVVADCDAERMRYEHLAEGVDERHRAIAVQSPDSIAADIQLGRSVREGLETAVSKDLFFTAKDGSPDGFDARLKFWDRCTDSAAPFFAKGNPFDDPSELAHEAAWASYYCGRFSVHALGSAQDPKTFAATFELVKAHELERRPLVAKSIEAMQANARSK
jgi:hypothetical protein